MDEQWRDALEGFASVWQRVQRSEEKPPLPAQAEDAVLFETLLQCAAQAEAGWHRTARALRGADAALVLRMADQCRRDLQTLRTAYFLRCGSRCAMTAVPWDSAALPEHLRRLWQTEERLSGLLRDAEVRGLSRDCDAMWQRSRQRQETVFRLLRRVLG